VSPSCPCVQISTLKHTKKCTTVSGSSKGLNFCIVLNSGRDAPPVFANIFEFDVPFVIFFVPVKDASRSPLSCPLLAHSLRFCSTRIRLATARTIMMLALHQDQSPVLFSYV